MTAAAAAIPGENTMNQTINATMMLAGLAMAWAVYRYLGLAFLRRTWLNLDVVWGASLVVAGAAGLGMAL